MRATISTAALPVVPPTVAATIDDPARDAGLAYLRAATWLLATVHGYGEAWERLDVAAMAHWHRARQRAERQERAAWAVFAPSRVTAAMVDSRGRV